MGKKYIWARNRLVNAWMIILFELPLGILYLYIMAQSLKNGEDFSSATKNLSDNIMLFCSIHLAILVFFFRMNVGVSRILTRCFMAVVVFIGSIILVEKYVFTKIFASTAEREKVSLILFVLIAIIEPVIAILRMKKHFTRYNDNLQYKKDAIAEQEAAILGLAGGYYPSENSDKNWNKEDAKQAHQDRMNAIRDELDLKFELKQEEERWHQERWEEQRRWEDDRYWNNW